MNKTELIDAIAEKAELPTAQAKKFLKAFEETVTETLKAGQEVVLIGFGTFLTSTRAARVGRNPSTGKPIDIPPATVPKFKPGALLKRAVI